jgi:hypothetical protein
MNCVTSLLFASFSYPYSSSHAYFQKSKPDLFIFLSFRLISIQGLAYYLLSDKIALGATTTNMEGAFQFPNKDVKDMYRAKQRAV